jgi:hypothetical protein
MHLRASDFVSSSCTIVSCTYSYLLCSFPAIANDSLQIATTDSEHSAARLASLHEQKKDENCERKQKIFLLLFFQRIPLVAITKATESLLTNQNALSLSLSLPGRRLKL